MISDNTITKLIADSALMDTIMLRTLLKKTAEAASRSGYLPPDPSCGKCKYSAPTHTGGWATCRINPPLSQEVRFPLVQTDRDWCSYFTEVTHAE